MKKTLGIIAVVLLIVAVSLYFFLSKVTVTFDTGGSTFDVKVRRFTSVEKPQDPVKENYIFKNWLLDDEEYDFSTKITKNITLYANFVANSDLTNYTITFDTDGGEAVSDISVIDGKITKLPVPTKEGYTFLGWFNGDKEVKVGDIIDESLKLTAKWEKEEMFTITFDSNGGEPIDKQKVKKDETVTKPTNPTKSGYTFNYWTLNGSEYDFTSKVTKNITLVAKWTKGSQTPTKTEYTVKFDSQGGSSVANQKVEENQTVTKPTNPTKSGYTFLGWTMNGSEYNFDSKVTKNITLVAKWQKNPEMSYTIEDVSGSTVGEVYLYILKDGVKIDGTCDITTPEGKTITKAIPKTGYRTNKSKISKVTNIKSN